jgi:5'-nucleotidase
MYNRGRILITNDDGIESPGLRAAVKAVLKIDVPNDATPLTEWKITKLAKTVYYSKVIENPTPGSKICDGKTVIEVDQESLDPDTDIYALAVDKIVSITPLSIDLTSRVLLSDLQEALYR